jgi:cell division transport system permease protein
MTLISYAVRDGISNFTRAKLAAVGSILTITISLLLLGIFYIISAHTARLVADVRSKIEMEAFLEEPVSRQHIADLQKTIQLLEGVDHVQFVSKDEAAKIFKEEFGEDINAVLDFNPLPPSFKVFLKEEARNAVNAEALAKKLQSIQGVNKVAYRKDMLQFLDERSRTLYYIGLCLGVLLGISAIFLVSNTIRLAISAKRKAIQTMKLVGASRMFIRAPFLIEGITQGLIGGLIAAALLYYVVSFAIGLISTELASYVQVGTLFYAGVLAAGAFLGLFGSAISVRRFIGESVY